MERRTPKWRRYLRFFGPDVNSDIQDELSFHLEAKTKELTEQGIPSDEAQKRAMRHFGDLQEVATMCREISQEHSRKLAWTERLIQTGTDIRNSIRGLKRAPGFAIIVILTLAAGIAGTSSLFSIVDAWILRSVRFPEPQQLVYIRSLAARQGREIAVSMPDYVDLKARASSLQSLAGWSSDSFTLSLDSSPERVTGVKVTSNFFDTIGVQPALGRTFLATETEYGNHRVMIVSHGFWKSRLHEDAKALGSIIQIDGEPFTVIGVVPERFHFTLAGRANLWLPLALPPQERESRQMRFLQLLGRMKPQSSIETARRELKTIASDLAKNYPDTNRDVGSFSILLSEEIGRHTGEQVLWVVFAVALGLLLIACSNTANLLLVRAQARQRQASIQLSLGASRGRLLREALIETLLLFITASVIGAVAGGLAISALTGMIPAENRGYLPDYGEASLNLRVFGFALALTLVTGLAFGLGPAFESTRVNVLNVLKEAGSAVSQAARAKRLRLVFVVSQIALATILLSSTALLVSTFRSIWSAPRGFDSEGLLTFKLSLNERAYPDATQRRLFFESVLEAMPRQPGLPDPAIARFVPFGGDSGSTSFRIPGTPAEAQDAKLFTAGFNSVSPAYFSTLRTPVLAGRAFRSSDSEGAPSVAIVNDAFVARHLSGESPIGRRVQLTRLKNRAVEIVGVVTDIRQNASQGNDKVAQVYVPFAQATASEAVVVIRSNGGSAVASLLPEIRRRVAAIDPMQPVYDAKSMDELLAQNYAPYQIISGMLVWFGVLALAMAAIGVYGVIAYSASQRTREIGIRAALGAGRPKLVHLFIRQGVVMLQVGLVPGLIGSFAAAVGLRSLLTDLQTANPVLPLLVTASVLGITILLATLIPAWRASSVDPLTAIRYDG